MGDIYDLLCNPLFFNSGIAVKETVLVKRQGDKETKDHKTMDSKRRTDNNAAQTYVYNK